MFLKKESGRSMVEMLAVLAIIGIITLGGLTGYRKAMRRLHANKIGEYIAALSTEAQIHNATVDLSDLDDYDLGNPPECIQKMTGYKGGQVRVFFDTKCLNYEELRDLIQVSFSKCKFGQPNNNVVKGVYYYVPKRGQKCDASGCKDTCEDFVPEDQVAGSIF